ncbi:putative nucleotide-sugar transporter [Lyophyllum shimeji]|uniref:Nucleotide-sugar transporter n=1 Tax=Lyophyllum shimeji TaxID=47721 RepID=A0A9P3PF77_LYOSH|nr:putative nucleotide-sugar transporter [Lyophyllum shimeji]
MAQYPSATLFLKSVHDHDQEMGETSEITTPPSLWGVPLKHISLVTLAIQNSTLALIMHHSRVSTPPSRAYSAATAVLMTEILKGLVSLVIAYLRVDHSSDGPQTAGLSWASKAKISTFRLRRLSNDIFSQDCWKLSIPAILYVIQNNLQYVAASNLDAATFQVTYQMKILTTAGFSVLLLRRKLCSSQWIALLFLAIGVGIVQIQAGEAQTVPATLAAVADVHTMHRLKGFLAVAAACFTSGLAGVYFEMVLKNTQGDLWVRNVQLSLFSLLPALAPLIFSHASTPAVDWLSALFRNFGLWAWATVAVQVLGGLVTALVIKYSDNILKGFATSLSIVLSFLASVALFHFQMTFTFGLGAGIVLGATWLYNQPPKRAGLLRARDSSFWGLPRTEKHREDEDGPVQRPFTFYAGRTTSTSSSTSSLSSLPTVVLTPPPYDSASEKALYVR